MIKAYYASTRDKSLTPIQGYEIFVKDGDVYDRCCFKGRMTKWRRCYMIPANIIGIGIEQARGEKWPLKIKYRGFELSHITDSKIVNRSGPK